MEDWTNPDAQTSCVEFISSVHGTQRRKEREVSKRDLQAAVKHGIKERGTPHPHTKAARWKYTFADVVYITNASSTEEVTSWAFPLPLAKAPVNALELQQIRVQKKRVQTGTFSHLISPDVVVNVPFGPFLMRVPLPQAPPALRVTQCW
jgi:hypothetical protein